MTDFPLRLDRVTLTYGKRPVVHDLSLEIPHGPAGIALVGESGSGKTTVARSLLGMIAPTAGQVLFHGRDLAGFSRAEMATYRRAVQPVFQDGTEALDPRMSIGAAIAEAISVSPDAHLRGAARTRRVSELLDDVGLPGGIADRLPHQISGGQRQRVCIARALAVRPSFLLLDEPTSALDVTVQARILELLRRLQTEHSLTYLLITHNLAIVESLCTSTAVMFGGRIVEQGSTSDVLRSPAHPYTASLISALPRMGGQIPTAVGRADVGSAESGCAFRLRCPIATDACQSAPALQLRAKREVACVRADEVAADRSSLNAKESAL
jgi:peptide/nickel transport system ATP-binding protein